MLPLSLNILDPQSDIKLQEVFTKSSSEVSFHVINCSLFYTYILAIIKA